MNQRDQDEFQKLLVDSLKLYTRELRNEFTGQYFDALPLSPGSEKDFNSSVAATGMGLVALALSDALGTESDSREKALITLRAIVNSTANGKPYMSSRAKNGWFRHWFDSRTGENNGGSIADGFSTIDTAILVAGAQLSAKYFKAKGQDIDGAIESLADHLLLSVNWDSAISNLESGLLHLNFDLHTEKPKASTAVFNEYVVVACMGKAAAARGGRGQQISQFWNRHFKNPEGLPKKNYEGIELLTDHPSHFLSSFTMQFASFLCADVGGSEKFQKYFENAQSADRAWFSKNGSSGHLWGLGAGESFGTYHADSINDNPEKMVSPHIVAGFLPVYPEGIHDLLAMQRSGECTASYGDLKFLWRCSLADPGHTASRLQAIDFSTMFLGLSAFDPRIGFDFFLRNSAH